MKFCIGSLLVLSLPLGRAAIDEAINADRQLAKELIASYEPETIVTSHNAMDLDQKLFMLELALNDVPGFQTAMHVYTRGAFSYPVAVLTLDTPLVAPLFKDLSVIGVSVGNSEVKGFIDEDYNVGEEVIRVRYETNEDQNNYVGCLVAANPSPVLDGCFQEDGFLVISTFTTPFDYKYDPETQNESGRSIASLSTTALEKMENCKNCPYVDYQKFKNYYGLSNYADIWVRSAANQQETPFENGGASFVGMSRDGTYEAMTKGTVVMSFWMYVIREMEHALDLCEDPDEEFGLGVKGFDRAVAFWVGSLEGAAGIGEGVLMYNLADKLCTQFRTCGVNGDLSIGTSYVNHKVMETFRDGQSFLKEGNCTATREIKHEAVRLMTIPLIQSVLHSAYIQDGLTESVVAESQGATYAASLLPIIYDCGLQGRRDAATIYQNLRIGHGEVSFAQVKAAIERQYTCLNLTCSEVGGVWNVIGGQYEPGAVPCGLSTDSINTGLVVGLSAGGALLLGVLVAYLAFFRLRRNHSTEPVEEVVIDDDTPSIA